VDGEQGTVAIIFPLENQAKLRAMQISTQLLHISLQLRLQLFIALFRRENEKFLQFPSAQRQLVPFLNLLLKEGQPPRGLLGLHLVRPQVRLRQPFLQLTDLFLLAS
jgi:hypothetical protein